MNCFVVLLLGVLFFGAVAGLLGWLLTALDFPKFDK